MGPEVLLLPLAPLYAGVVRLRAAAYRRGWLPRKRAPVPVVSVGNLAFGGTGKTPTVMALVRDLRGRGRRPAVLTRGYGRRERAPVVLVGPDPGVGTTVAGDEPLLLAEELPGVPVVVDADRARGARAAAAAGADVVVLDDGFQHLRLQRDLDLVLLDAGDPWAGGSVPPRGRLREPLSALGRASAVLVTKLPREGAGERLREIARRVGALAPGVPVLGARMKPTRLRTPEGLRRPEELVGRPVMAFAGLARPQGFLQTLEELGARVKGFRAFPDHHEYSASELGELEEEAARQGALPVTTAKDAVKLPAGSRVLVLDVAMVPLGGSWDELWKVAPEVAG